MRVACLTFHNSQNYGSVLQTYALQETVKGLGHDYHIIDYSTPEKRKFDSILGRNREMSLPHYLLKLASLPLNIHKQRRFADFSRMHLSITPRYSDYAELLELNDRYDRFICGSDQVWNAEMVRYDPSYFLTFVSDPDRKFAYAASFGVSSPSDRDLTFYSDMFSRFGLISVREKTGQDIIARCSKHKARLVLDPTLLLSTQQWNRVARYDYTSGQYILVYALRHDDSVQAFIRKLRLQTGLKVVYISRGVASILRDRAVAVPSPQQWLGLFQKAAYVVTTSFHGTAFSVNFNRPFFTFVKQDLGNTNSRIVDFLDLVGMKDRIYTTCPNGEVDLNTPDFSRANRVLLRKRDDSIRFLEEALSRGQR